MRVLALLLVLPFALSSCSPSKQIEVLEPEAADQVVQESPAAERQDPTDGSVQFAEETAQSSLPHAPSSQVDPAGRYAAYTEEVIGNGQTSVLYFHASWCPVCKNADAKLQQWYAGDGSGFPLTVYKVDYDSSDELKSRYGVTYQHTFVKIDGSGNMVERIQGPTDDQLQALLNG